MNEKEKNLKQAERQENLSQDSEQNEKNECRSAVLAWWNSFIRMVLGNKNDISDRLSIGLGFCSILLVFLLLLFISMMELKGVRVYDYF